MSTKITDANQIITPERLTRELAACGVGAGQHIIVHASLSAIGWVLGGAETVVRALTELVGPEGTIMMPAQSWRNLDPATGVHWELDESLWPIVREHWPAFNPRTTPSAGMGIIAETLRTWPGSCRSDHPARSFSAVGKHAEHLMRDHDLSNIFGEGSPLAKLYELDGSILLLGTGHNKNTSLHMAETQATYPGKHEAEESSAVMVNGRREWVTYRTLAVEDADFVELGDAFERKHAIIRHRVGNAEARLMRQRALVDFAVEWMNRNRA